MNRWFGSAGFSERRQIRNRFGRRDIGMVYIRVEVRTVGFWITTITDKVVIVIDIPKGYLDWSV